MPTIHPIDNRYSVPKLEQFLSEDALLKYVMNVELSHLETLMENGTCPPNAYSAIGKRAGEITGEMWAEKQKDPKYKHNIRALMALVNDGLPQDMRGYFHLGLTSYDAIDNGYLLGLRDATTEVILPAMGEFLGTLIDIADKYKSTVQIGRSHGQHGEPTTFGREIAVFVDRWGKAEDRVADSVSKLEGKIGGAMGTKASLELLGDSQELESRTLDRLELPASRISTQIVQPEDASNYYSQVLTAFGILDDLANNMRQLARTEIGEIALEASEGQGRSSTMLHKGMSEKGVVIGNPEDFENICGQYRAVMPHIISVYLNQQSEHNRDIRNSAPERFYKPEILSAFVYSVERMNKTMKKVVANEQVMRERVENAWNTLMEPAYIVLALDGEANPQKYVRDAVEQYDGDFREMLEKDERLKEAIGKLPAKDRLVFENPCNYIGTAVEQTKAVIDYWERRR